MLAALIVRSLASVLSVATIVTAAPAPVTLVPRQITTLSTSQIASFKPFSFFASAAYCSPSSTLAWNCGANCNANAGFIPTASGGDGSSVQFWYVGFSPSQNSVIVAHQGTDPSKIQALVSDANAILGRLDTSLFPGVPTSVEVHEGFRNEHAKTASQILSAVQRTLSAHGSNRVTVVGHSLGAALALLEGVYLHLHLSGVTLRTVTYSMPRVGNQAFADFVDTHGISLTHINNKEDFIPILPGRFLGYHHPSGEVHIQDSNAWASCPGQDNTSGSCTVGDVSNIFEGHISDHNGPFDGVQMGC